jgi:hypothetical protein
VFYLTVAFFFGLAGGVVGKLKGSSFFLWFLISGIIPVIGLITALLYRFETEEPRRECPNCGRVCMLYDAICIRCGAELEYPDATLPSQAEVLSVQSGAKSR